MFSPAGKTGNDFLYFGIPTLHDVWVLVVIGEKTDLPQALFENNRRHQYGNPIHQNSSQN